MEILGLEMKLESGVVGEAEVITVKCCAALKHPQQEPRNSLQYLRSSVGHGQMTKPAHPKYLFLMSCLLLKSSFTHSVIMGSLHAIICRRKWS